MTVIRWWASRMVSTPGIPSVCTFWVQVPPRSVLPFIPSRVNYLSTTWILVSPSPAITSPVPKVETHIQVVIRQWASMIINPLDDMSLNIPSTNNELLTFEFKTNIKGKYNMSKVVRRWPKVRYWSFWGPLCYKHCSC